MKIRTVALGLKIWPQDFILTGEIPCICSVSDVCELDGKIATAKVLLEELSGDLTRLDYVVQTQRIVFNSFEDWLMPLLHPPYSATLESIVAKLSACLEKHSIQFCSIGCCSTESAMNMLPKILSLSDHISSSVRLQRSPIAPDAATCRAAARACLDTALLCGDLGNFRYCVSFNCQPGIPFFPAAYCDSGATSTDSSGQLSIGFESGDLLFLAFHGADSLIEGRDNLEDIMRQALLPVQQCAELFCKQKGIDYLGIDASINPGLGLPDSVGVGLETLLENQWGEHNSYFGCMGTLAVVSTITSAVKSLANPGRGLVPGIKLVGYSGVMLPVMEDVILSQRAVEGKYSIRDLLVYSSLCGVGLDTVPIPGDTSIESLAGIYSEVGALAFRLDKPLSCRLLPMKNLSAGDMTSVESPYLCNTCVFSIP